MSQNINQNTIINVIYNDIRSVYNTHSDQLKVTKFYTAVSLFLDSHIMPNPCSGYTSAHWGKSYGGLPILHTKRASLHIFRF